MTKPSSPRHGLVGRPAVRPGSRSLVGALHRRQQLRAGLVQLGYVAVGVALGVLTPRVTIGPTVSNEQLDAVFAGIAGGLIALVSIVYALLFLVVQFGSTTHSPRLNLFRDSPLVWHAFGFFLGSFAYVSTAALASKPGEQVSLLVPAIGLISVLASFGVARRLQFSALDSVQLAPILQNLGERGRAVIDQLYPHPYTTAPATPWPDGADLYGVRWPQPSAVLRQIDLPPLLAVAERLNARVRLLVTVGDMLWEDEAVIEISLRPTVEQERELLTGIEAGIERSFGHDPLLALRLLTDIGLRATASGNNDPFTAIQVIDRIEGLLRRLATRHLDVSVVADTDGNPRVQLSMPDWDQFVRAGVDELINASRNLPSVQQRLVTLLDDLIRLSPPVRLPVLQRRRARLAGYDR